MEFCRSEATGQKVRTARGVPLLVDKVDVNEVQGHDGIYPRSMRALKGEFVQLWPICKMLLQTAYLEVVNVLGAFLM